MQDPLIPEVYKFDKEELDIFVEYEVASHPISGYIDWDWVRECFAAYIHQKALRKYRRYLKFKNVEKWMKSQNR